MQSRILVVYDSKAEAYGRPFVVRSTGEGIRSFGDEINSGRDESQLSSHPEDFTLFEIGTWDDASGVIELYEAKKSLGVGLDFKRDGASESKVRALN